MKETLAKVFKETRSKIIATGSMLVLFSAIALVPNAGVLGQVFGSSVPFAQKVAFSFTLLGSPAANATMFGFVAILVSIFLSGVVIALAVYAFSKRTENVGAMGVSGLGMVSAFIGIGCASCGSLLLSALIPILGIGAFVSILPLGGLEFSILGVVLLLVSIYLLLMQIAKPSVCAVA
ncbi:MAG: hypothetical protein ABA06_01095 [Parcubacteria bacterium C7867-001]|nr:MAG: hypothetical protein ABA06_01095 [Parcubacteria bacterium C7867-001]